MRLTRVVHASWTARYGPADVMLPDVAAMRPENDDRANALLFIDGDGLEVHAYLVSDEQAREIAAALRGGIEVVRTFEEGMLK